MIVSCNPSPSGNSEGIDEGQESDVLIGSFIDSPVKGLRFVTSSGIEGTTDKNGNFTYKSGDDINFFIGDQAVGGSVKGSKTVSPLEVCNATNIDESSKATNLIRVLLALDTKENPYGLTIPDNIEKINKSETSLNAILEMDDTEYVKEIKDIIAEIKNISAEYVEVPTIDDAKEHFDVSVKLIESINSADYKYNMFITVKVPEERSGSVYVSYTHGADIEGVTSYPSGTSGYIDETSATASIKCEIYQTDYILNLSQFANNNGVQVGDILCFYTDHGFKPTPALGFPLIVGSEQINLQANLEKDGATVQTVYETSGYIEVPKLLPNNEDYKDFYREGSFTIFINLLDDNDRIVGGINVNPKLDTTAGWEEVEGDKYNKYRIKFSTSLPGDLLMDSQIYIMTKPDDNSVEYDLVDWQHFEDKLTSVVTDYNFTAGTWSIRE